MGNTSDHGYQTTLAEDVIFLINSQQKVLIEYLTTNGYEINGHSNCTVGRVVFMDGMTFLFQQVHEIQTRNRVLFLTNLKDTCAAANDFLRMSTLFENLLEDLYCNYPFLMYVVEHDSKKEKEEKEKAEAKAKAELE